MTKKESPTKKKLNKAFADNDKAHKEFIVALDEWTESWDKGCKRIAKILE